MTLLDINWLEFSYKACHTCTTNIETIPSLIKDALTNTPISHKKTFKATYT